MVIEEEITIEETEKEEIEETRIVTTIEEIRRTEEEEVDLEVDKREERIETTTIDCSNLKV